MTKPKQTSVSRAERMVSRDGDFTLHRAQGKPPIPGISRQTTGAQRRERGITIGLGTARRARGLSQQQVGQRLGVEQTHISRIERNKDVLLSTVAAYADALGARSITITMDFDEGERIELPIESAPVQQAGTDL